MTVYMTEAEQVEVIKKWWNKHGNLALTIFSVFLLIIAGFRYWHWQQVKLDQQASNTYEQMMLAFSNQDAKRVRGYANTLTTTYKNTVYADAARLAMAKFWSDKEDFAKAIENLSYVAKNSQVMALQSVAQIRLARVLLAEKSYQAALKQLLQVKNAVYLPMVNELKGDIFAATGQYPLAKNAYQEALLQTKMQGTGNLFLEMKAHELAALT